LLELTYVLGFSCHMLKTVDIHPPKTEISVHFSNSLTLWLCKISLLFRFLYCYLHFSVA
jgi:hypothetical protein